MHLYDLNLNSAKIVLPQYILNLQHETKLLNVTFNANRSFTVIKKYFHYHPNTLLRVYDINIYKQMLSWAIKMLPLAKEMNTSLSLYASVATHIHDFTPQTPYLAITFAFIKNNTDILKLKVEPYIGENNQWELGQGVTAQNLNPFTYKNIYNYIDNAGIFRYINLSPSNLYSFVLVNKLNLGEYETVRNHYRKDIRMIENFFNFLNQNYKSEAIIENGYLKNKIPNCKQLSLLLEGKNIKFPHISSLVKKL